MTRNMSNAAACFMKLHVLHPFSELLIYIMPESVATPWTRRLTICTLFVFHVFI